MQKEDIQNLLFFIVVGKIKEYKDLLSKIEINLEDIQVDEYKSNLIHLLAEQNKYGALKFTIDLFQEKNKSKEIKFKFMKWINQQNSQGTTPIYHAVYNGNMKMVNYLMNLGTNIHIINYLRENLIHAAVKNDQILPLIYLSQYLDLNQCDASMRSPLIIATFKGNFQIVEFLLQQKVNLNLQDEKGNTALHYAVSKENIKLVYKLLIYGAKYDIKNDKKQTALDITLSNKETSMIRLFKSTNCLLGLSNYSLSIPQMKSKFKLFFSFFILLFNLGLIIFFCIPCKLISLLKYFGNYCRFDNIIGHTQLIHYFIFSKSRHS